MNLENVISNLADEGISAKKNIVFKNGIECECLSVARDEGMEVRPVVYIEECISEEELMEKARELADMPNSYAGTILECLTSTEYFLSHVNLAILRQVPEDSVSLPYLGQKLCVKLHITGFLEGNGSTIITQAMLDNLGLDKDAVVKMAAQNTNERLIVNTVANAIGVDDSLFDADMFVFTTKDGIDGGAVLAFKHLFRDLCEERGLERKGLILLPSSIEEILAIPFEDSFDPLAGLEMVKEINESCIDPKLWLNPAIYKYSYDNDTIEVIAGGGDSYGCIQ